MQALFNLYVYVALLTWQWLTIEQSFYETNINDRLKRIALAVAWPYTLVFRIFQRIPVQET